MPEELKEFDLGSFDIGMNEATGELELSAKEPEKKEEVKQEQVNQEQPDRFATFENTFNSRLGGLEQVLQRQSNALGLIMQGMISANQPAQPELTEENQHLSQQIANQVQQPINELRNQISPIVAEQQARQEFQQFMNSVSDGYEYVAGMNYLMSTIQKEWSLPELYMTAKRFGLRQQPQKQEENKGNVTDINRGRELPNRVQSNNSNLQTKEVPAGKDGLKVAMENALNELGYGT